MLSLMRPGDRVLDVGAHLGTFALPAARLGCSVTAVEASPRNARLLAAAADASGLADRLEVVNAAATDAGGEVEFAEYGPYGSIACDGMSPESGFPTVTVPAVTLDSLGGNGSAATPFDWLKVDVEGSECEVLGGGERTVGRARALAIESNGYMLDKHGRTPAELLSRLYRSGHSLYAVEGVALSPLRRRLFQPETTVDYVATRRPPPQLPEGWSMRPACGRRELAGRLARELAHPVPQHRAYALVAASTGPAWVRTSRSVRSGMRSLEADPDDAVAAARASLSRRRAR
jgi:FkbM family methyltransferase